MDKYAWTLARPHGSTDEELRHLLLSELPTALPELVPGLVEASVTIQEQGRYQNAEQHGTNVDALLEITTEVEFPPLDPLIEHLESATGGVQGWRVEPTLIFDAREPVAIGAPSAGPLVIVFIQRLDGTTAEHFSRNWFVHAGYPAEEAAKPAAERRPRPHREEDGAPSLYRQNRILEITTPTEWVIHGYTQLQMPVLIDAQPQKPYERWRHEEPYDRWPPRILHGYQYRVV